VRGYETNAYLPYHTDAGDMVGLLCLRRGLEGGLSSIVSSVTVHNEILAHHPEYLGLLYNGFYYIRREAALTERGISERPIPIFGCRDGVVSCRYIRNQINAGAVKREVPLTRLEQAALDYLDEQTRAPTCAWTWICGRATSSSSTTTRPCTRGRASWTAPCPIRSATCCGCG
jgi:hypothetical protein